MRIERLTWEHPNFDIAKKKHAFWEWGMGNWEWQKVLVSCLESIFTNMGCSRLTLWQAFCANDSLNVTVVFFFIRFVQCMSDLARFLKAASLAGKIGAELLDPIVGIGIILWDVWDYNRTVAIDKPILRENIADYLEEMKLSILANPENGIMTAVDKIESEILESIELNVV